MTIFNIFKTYEKGTLNSEKYDFAVMNFDMCNGPTRNGVNPSKPGAGLSLNGYWPNVPSSALGLVYNRGYPGMDQACGSNAVTCNTRIWGDHGAYSSKSNDFVEYKSVTVSGGHSGSGTYAYWSKDNKPYVVCVHISSAKCPGQSYSKEARCKRITNIFDDLIKDTSVNF
ncbi:MAG: hypothetical protein AAGJ35_10650 [Myxococcota bacterium]